MHLYVLAQEGQNIASPVAPVWGASRVTVRGNNWAAARATAAQHAIDAGHKVFGIVVGTVELYYRPHNQQHHTATEFDRHGLWLYLHRLACRFGHVYVPPLAWARNRSFQAQQCLPTIPLVAAYSTKAVAQLDDLESKWGYELCGLGYDSWTVHCYFHFNYAPYPQLDETGSAATWLKRYQQHTKGLL
jgi:hypothetical protein